MSDIINFVGGDIVDSYIIYSELDEIELSQAEIDLQNECDSMSEMEVLTDD